MNQFSRLLKIMDEETLERFKNAHVLLVGVGGVGEQLLKPYFAWVLVILPW